MLTPVTEQRNNAAATVRAGARPAAAVETSSLQEVAVLKVGPGDQLRESESLVMHYEAGSRQPFSHLDRQHCEAA